MLFAPSCRCSENMPKVKQKHPTIQDFKTGKNESSHELSTTFRTIEDQHSTDDHQVSSRKQTAIYRSQLKGTTRNQLKGRTRSQLKVVVVQYIKWVIILQQQPQGVRKPVPQETLLYIREVEGEHRNNITPLLVVHACKFSTGDHHLEPIHPIQPNMVQSPPSDTHDEYEGQPDLHAT